MTQEDAPLLLPEEKTYAREYRYRQWWIDHHFALRRTGLLMVFVLEILLLLAITWRLLDAFVLSASDHDQAVAQMVTYGPSETHAFALSQQAKDLQLSSARALSVGDGQYDLYAEVSNPNDAWWAEVIYGFSSGGKEFGEGAGFVLPQSQSPLVIFSVSSSSTLSSVTVELKEIVWHRLDAHEIPDYAVWKEDRFRLDVTDISFDPAFELNGKKVGRMTFTLTNKGPYGFYELPLYLVLSRGGNVVGVNRTELSSLDAGETREVTVNWFGVVPNTNTYEVIPVVNLFDPSVYQEF